MKIVKALYNQVYYIFRKCKEDEVGIYAAQASFFITLSIFPFFIMLFSIIMLIPSGQDSINHFINTNMPNIIKDVLTTSINALSKSNNITALVISTITAIWSASKGVMSMMIGLYKINKVNQNRLYIINRGISMAYTFVFALALILSGILVVLGKKITSYIFKEFPDLSQVPYFSAITRYLLLFLSLVFFFTIVYKMANRKNTTLFKSIPGALFSAAGWLLFSFFFSLYIDKFANYSAVYGAFSSLILLMLWVYFIMYIMFIGEEINKHWGQKTMQ